MTVISKINKIKATGNGITTAFPAPFKVPDEINLEVYKVTIATGLETLQSLNVDYTVVINPSTEEATVTYTVAPTTLEYSFIRRVLPLDQTTDIPTESILPEEQLENAYDKNLMISQQIQEESTRSIILPISSDLSNLILPTPESRRAILWNETEDGLINSTNDLDLIAADAQASADAAAVSESNAATSAGNASTSAGNAAVSEANAAASAAEAAAKVGIFESAAVEIKIDNYNLLAGDAGKLMVMDNAAAKAFVFPDIIGDEVYHIKNIGLGVLTLTPDGSDSIEILTLTKNEGVTLIADGTNNVWRALERYTFDATEFDVTEGSISIKDNAIKDNHIDFGLGAGQINTDDIPQGTVNVYGKLVQIVNTQTGSVIPLTVIIPFDDTIPQNNEGNEVMTLAITPTNVNSKLRIDVVTHQEADGAPVFNCVALFRDGIVDALAAAGTPSDSSSVEPANIAFTHWIASAGSIAPTIFKVRCGASASTGTFNGESGVRRFGGVYASSITITEISA